MKKIRNFILKEQKIYVGLEDSKKTWKVVVRSGQIVIQRISIAAEYDVLSNYFKNNFPECKITVIYEAGFRGFELHDRLIADGWSCIVTPPHTVTQQRCSRQKNDSIDADRLAKNLENGDFKYCHVPQRAVREDRQVSRIYGQLQKDCTRISNRIRRTIEFHGLERYFPSGTWTRAQYIEAQKRLDTLSLSSSLQYCLKLLFTELHQLRQHQRDVLKVIRKLAKSDRYQKTVTLLRSAPGIGPLTAVRLALEWGDIRRFRRKEEFSSFLGLIPSEDSTGDTEHFGHITKQGNREVRGWLVESAWVAIRHDPVLLDKFNRVGKNSQGLMKYKKRAIVAVARKLGIRLRSILINEQPYQIGVECG